MHESSRHRRLVSILLVPTFQPVKRPHLGSSERGSGGISSDRGWNFGLGGILHEVRPDDDAGGSSELEHQFDTGDRTAPNMRFIFEDADLPSDGRPDGALR